MHLSDLRIHAMDGSVLVEGRLDIESDEPAAASLPTRAGTLVGASFAHQGFGRSKFILYGEAQRAGDGFWGAAAPLMTVFLEEAVPDFESLLARAFTGRGRLHVRVDGLRLAMVSVRYSSADAWRELYGHLQALDLVLAREEEGLRISFSGPIGPMAFHGESPLFARARLVGDFVVPRSYWKIRGLTGPMWPAGTQARVGSWSPWNDGLGRVALGEYAALFCEGKLDWGQGDDVRLPRGPFVEARIDEHQLMLRPAGELDLLANGFAASKRYSGSAPELTMFFGHAELARMLEGDGDATFEWRGAAAGHLDGLTGRDAYEEGFRRQPLSQLRVHATRDRAGVRLRGVGELLPLKAGGGPSLGPRVEFEIDVPRGYFLLRGLPPREFWAEWKQDYPSATTW